MKFLDRLTTRRRQYDAALALLALMRKTVEKLGNPDNAHLADLRTVAAEGLPASLRTTWRGDGTLCLEFHLGEQQYVEPIVLPEGHSSPVAYMTFAAFIAAWGEAAEAHARQLKTAP